MLQADADHPPPRDHRTGPRRSEERPARAPALGEVRRELRWLVLAAMAFNLTRAAGCLASLVHAKASTATLRTQLINVAARAATSARRTTLHLPTAWPWAEQWQRLFTAAIGPPAAT
jgi:Transposase DDE domain group 1